MNYEIGVTNLAFNKSSNENTDFKKYEINVDLEEESSTEHQTMLKYSLDLTSKPKNSVISISGNAKINGTQKDVEEYLKQDDERVPSIVSTIYQELFPLMYIISKDMKIPSPAHTISQNNVKDNPIDTEITSEDHTGDVENTESPIEDTPEDKTEIPEVNESEKDILDETNIDIT
ncbi:hypothetical protein [Nitrosopumilus sp. S6]